MTSAVFVVLLSAVSGYVLGSTLKPVEEMNMEDSVLYIMNQMRTMEERLLLLESREKSDDVQKVKDEILVECKKAETKFAEEKNELAEKIAEIESTFTNRLSEMEKATKLSLYEMSERLLVEKNKLLVMDNHLLYEVHQLQKGSLETYVKISNVENEVKNVSEGGRMKADLLEVRLNETVGLVTSCLASQRETEESVQTISETLKKHVNEDLVPRLEIVHSNITDRIGNIESSLGKLRNQYANFTQVSNQQKTDFKLAVENYTTEVNQMKQELSRFQSICSPPCENGGQCVKNVCQCVGLFAGDRCQEAVCSPPCENDGQCMKNNTCICTRLFTGDRCQQYAACSPSCKNGGQCMNGNICKCTPLFQGDRCQDWQCGVDFDTDASTEIEKGGGNHNKTLVWPWFAALYKRNTAEYICAGSVIHRHFVLTSGFCADHYKSYRFAVKLGLTDFKNRTHLQEYSVRSVYVHPQYKQGASYDIALLKLVEPIEYNNFVRPICLPPTEIPQQNQFYKSQSSVKAVEDLRSYYLTKSSNIVKDIDLFIQPPEICRSKNTNLEKYYPSPDLVFCARAERDSTCSSGSPMIQSHLAGDGTRFWTQVGVGGWCFNTDLKYVFSARYQDLMPWVNATIEAALMK